MNKRKRYLSAAAAAIALGLTPALVVLAENNDGYGPYPSMSPDSGTCGNNWADDAVNRVFTIQGSAPNAITVNEQFQNGTFKTPSSTAPNTNQSPGACQNPPPKSGLGGHVDAGVTGTFEGYFVIPLPPGTVQTSTDPHCNAATMTNANCDTMTFIDTHFTPCYGLGTCSANTFFFSYNANGQCLIEHHWQNASADRGGNSGDIKSGPPCCQEGDGQGDFQGQQHGNFSADGDGCKDGDQDKVDSSDRGDGKDFHSTSVDSVKFDSVANTMTLTGAGLAGGLPTTFVLVALETGPTTPGWVSFTFGDGYTNAGALLNGSVLLH